MNCSLEGANSLVEVADGIRRIQKTLVVGANVCDDAIFDSAHKATDLEKLENNESLLNDLVNATHARTKPHGNGQKSLRLAIEVFV